jgi:hypothetical protein
MNNSDEDPVFKGARREALAIAVVAAFATAYTVVFCGFFGYDRAGEPIRFVLGFPAWVFWGVVAPWILCVAICGAFSWWFMRDEELGEEREETGDA